MNKRSEDYSLFGKTRTVRYKKLKCHIIFESILINKLKKICLFLNTKQNIVLMVVTILKIEKKIQEK